LPYEKQVAKYADTHTYEGTHKKDEKEGQKRGGEERVLIK